jgi:hypothetical protein
MTNSPELPSDCVKDVDHEILKVCRTIQWIPKLGSSAGDFALAVLAPLITPDTRTFAELEADIFP